MVQNQLLQRYVSSKPNHVICVDISFLTKKKSYFVGIYLATRVIVGHFYKKSPIQVKDIICYLDIMLEARKFTNKVEIIHSDRESLFINDNYYDYLKGKEVIISRGSSKGHENQVVERLHRTIKTKLKESLRGKNVTLGRVDSVVLKEELNAVIETYNNTPHKSNYGLSPNGINEAFVAFENKEKVGCCTVKALEKPAGEKALIVRDVLVKNDSSEKKQRSNKCKKTSCFKVRKQFRTILL